MTGPGFTPLFCSLLTASPFPGGMLGVGVISCAALAVLSCSGRHTLGGDCVSRCSHGVPGLAKAPLFSSVLSARADSPFATLAAAVHMMLSVTAQVWFYSS